MRISTNQIYERGAANLIEKQSKIAKLNEQITNGTVEYPSDDPIASSQIELINQRLNSISILQKNNDTITSGLNLQEGVLDGVMKTIQSLQTIQVQSGNAALSADDRHSLAIEAQNQLNQLMEYANSTDANGNYLFGGSRSNIVPVTKDYDAGTNAFVFNYNGDDQQRFQAVSDNLQVAINNTGADLFMRIPAGNGSFSITPTATPNTGSATVSSGGVSNPAAYVPGDYTMSFADVAGVLEVSVTDSSGATVLNAPYQGGSSITFNGMSMSVSGTPADGDSFSINSSNKASLFSTVQRMVANLNAPYANSQDKASIQTENGQLLMQLSSALSNVSNYISDIGGRLNQLETVNDTNSSLVNIANDTLIKLKGLDSNSQVDTIAAYSAQLVNLQVAQKSFVEIQGLSVFNYL